MEVAVLRRYSYAELTQLYGRPLRLVHSSRFNYELDTLVSFPSFLKHQERAAFLSQLPWLSAHSVRPSHVGDLEFVVPEFRLRRTAFPWLTDPATRVLIISWICQCSLVDRKHMTHGRRYTYLLVKS